MILLQHRLLMMAYSGKAVCFAGEVYNSESGVHEKAFGDGPAVEVELI